MNFKEILKLIEEKVVYNGEGGKFHEQSIAEVLESVGIQERTVASLNITKDMKKEMVKEDLGQVDMSNNTFIREPLGCRAPIDFLINVNGVLFVLEAKSSKGSVVMWNDNPPKPSFYYLISVKGRGNTMIKGSEWISEDKFESFIKCGEGLKNIFKQVADNPELDFEDVLEDFRSAFENAKKFRTDTGFKYNPRRMCIQEKYHFDLNTK